MTIQELGWVRIVLAIAMHVVIGLIAAWDLMAIATNHPDLSVSKITQSWAKESPVMPLAVGLVMGHLFWPIQ